MTSAPSSEPRIPRLAHRIWLDEPVPERLDAFWAKMAELHPDWKLITWQDSSPLALAFMRNRRIFDEQKTWAGKADVLRYEVLAAYGGVYLDADVEPLRNMDELLYGDPFIAWEDPRLLCPTVIGAPPKHPAVLALLDALPAWADSRRGAPPNHATGPYFITKQWRRRKDVRLLEPVSFYPVGWWEKNRLGGPYPPESFAVHHWDAGWLPNGPPQR